MSRYIRGGGDSSRERLNQFFPNRPYGSSQRQFFRTRDRMEKEATIPIDVQWEDPDLSRSTAEKAVRERIKRDQISELRAANEHLIKELRDREEQINILKELRAQEPIKPIVAPYRSDPHQRYGTPVMLLSDWHVEEPVVPAKVNGLNLYNLDIADKCIKDVAAAFEWLGHDSRYDCREAVIWLGGDLFSGYIHEELQEGNFLSPVQAVVWLQERIEKMFRVILATTNYERIIVPCNDGNHGRLTHRIRVSTRTANSLEWLMYQTLAARLSNEPRIQFDIAEGEYSYMTVYDRTLMFFHGDSVQYQGGVGGLLIPMRRGLNELRKYRSFDVANFGHFHTRIDLDELVGNGSMIGITPYSMRNKCQPEPPRQSWYMVDSVRGKCLSAPVWFEKRI